MALLDALPAIGAPSAQMVPQQSVEAAVAQIAAATADAVVPSQPAVAETPQRLDPAVAAERLAGAPERVEPTTRGPERRSSRDAEARSVRPSIRVSLDRLDALMNLVGELVITKSARASFGSARAGR
jgi:two-component system chemotaxis sensor kinase CheA